mmetsp:Transcript_15069/g.37007  ORF Transcript_15069/g.37007 Transcript_15069/m.37007 type:complete len:210 (+) Transcript_15069:3580-4209(+)
MRRTAHWTHVPELRQRVLQHWRGEVHEVPRVTCGSGYGAIRRRGFRVGLLVLSGVPDMHGLCAGRCVLHVPAGGGAGAGVRHPLAHHRGVPRHARHLRSIQPRRRLRAAPVSSAMGVRLHILPPDGVPGGCPDAVCAAEPGCAVRPGRAHEQQPQRAVQADACAPTGSDRRRPARIGGRRHATLLCVLPRHLRRHRRHLLRALHVHQGG